MWRENQFQADNAAVKKLSSVNASELVNWVSDNLQKFRKVLTINQQKAQHLYLGYTVCVAHKCLLFSRRDVMDRLLYHSLQNLKLSPTYFTTPNLRNSTVSLRK